MDKPFNLEDRFVIFAGEVINFSRSLPNDDIGKYYIDQILRSSGSSALHYGEAQGTNTTKDFIHKMSNVVKELKETKIALKILAHIDAGNPNQRKLIIEEVQELVAISITMIINARKKLSQKK